MFPVFHASADAMSVVGAIGGVTAISAAMIGLVMTDIKRVLAYSTISQLGYMMLALGVGAYVAAIFHLFTHAFFKALLFLGSGSVNHATNTFDMRLMGGLRRFMPYTFATFAIGSLSLAGVFPLAGFWSKDEILSDAWAHEPYLFWIALVTVGLTAFYMFRVIFLTFAGDYHGGGVPEDDGHGEAHHGPPHESPRVMTLPLLVLAIPAVIAGLANVSFLDRGLEHLLAGALPNELGAELEHTKFRWGIAIGSSAIAVGGIVLAYLIYYVRVVPAGQLQRLHRPAHTLLENKYYLDFLYERVIVSWLFYGVLCNLLASFDRVVIDGAVNGVGNLARQTGGALRYLQNGQFQAYGALAFASLVVAVIVTLALNPP
jgi:NADH-quinone oxidoreductase subunit L